MTELGFAQASSPRAAGGSTPGEALPGRLGRRADRRQWAAWSVALLAAVVLQAAAIRTQSLTSDEPYHLLAGHQALRYGENTLNLEHPPLVKMLAALPLLAEAEPLAPPGDVTNALGSAQAVFRNRGLEARIRVRARTLVLLGVVLPWWWMTYLVGRAAGGPRTGLLLALIGALSFGMLPYLAILTTDVAVALGFAATWVLAGKFLAAPRLLTAAGMGCTLGLAIAAKHSGLLLAPSVVLAIVLARGPRLDGRRRLGSMLGHRFGHLMAAALCAAALVELTYGIANRRYDPVRGRAAIGFYCANHSTLIVGDRMRRYQAPLLAIEERDPRLAQWLTGIVGIKVQNALAVYPSYIFGRIRSRGRWWYFPVLFLLKSSLVLLAATLWAGVEQWTGWRRRRRPSREPLPATPPGGVPAADEERVRVQVRRRFLAVLAAAAALYLAVAMSSNYDLGFRHLMPILPLLYLPAAIWAARRTWRLAAVAGLLLAESLAVAPLWMSATNTWWLGARNPTRFAASGDNCDWNQNLIVLGDRWHRRGLGPLHVLDPVVGAAALEVYLPGTVGMRPGDPLPAGWYAVGVIMEQAIPAILRATPAEIYNQAAYRSIAERWAPLWYQVRQGEDHGYIAGTFHLFRLAAPVGP